MKIDIMIGRAHRAATSSLKYYISQHSDILTHINLECDYFTSDHNNFKRYYSKYFDPAEKITLAKHAYLYKEEPFVKKLYTHNPDCKIIFIPA